MYAIIEKGRVVKYPTNPRNDFPHISFPENWSGGVIEGSEYVKVQQADQKGAPVGWHEVEIKPRYNKKKNIWLQKWKIEYAGGESLKRIISDLRYKFETDGVYIGNDFFRTDRESQTKYSIMASSIIIPFVRKKVYWKNHNGEFIKVDMWKVNRIVRKFVQNCFDNEKRIFDVIDTNNEELIKKTDFYAGWPDNKFKG